MLSHIAAATDRNLEIEKIEIAASTVVNRADEDFRLEVIAELVNAGIAPHVASNLTNTPHRLMAKAKEIGYI